MGNRNQSARAIYLVFFFSIGFLLLSLLQAQEHPYRKEITVRGKIVCLDERGEVHRSQQDCNQLQLGFGLGTDEGRFYKFLPADPRSEIFSDSRIRTQELEISGWLVGGNRLQIVEIHSVRDEQLNEVYYRCDVCNIKSYAPGPCWCCGQKFQLVEEPIS